LVETTMIEFLTDITSLVETIMTESPTEKNTARIIFLAWDFTTFYHMDLQT